MPTGKNLTTGAQGASTSTPCGAKTVSKSKSKSRQTKAEILKSLYDERQKVRKSDAFCKELMSVIAVRENTILQKDSEIATCKRNVEFWKNLNDSLHVCVDALLVSTRAMNVQCSHLQAEINRLK